MILRYNFPVTILTASCFANSGVTHCQYHQYYNECDIRQEKLDDITFTSGRHRTATAAAATAATDAAAAGSYWKTATDTECGKVGAIKSNYMDISGQTGILQVGHMLDISYAFLAPG